MIRLLLIIPLLWVEIVVCHCIVFIHIGPSLPEYSMNAIAQARLFNDCPIYLVAEKQAIRSSKCNSMWDENFHPIFTETLIRTKAHNTFLKNSALNHHNNPFWIYASERFFYLDELINQYNLKDVFHLENDVMVYTDLSKLMPIFKQHYLGIGAVFDNDLRCIPGFMFIAHKNCMSELADYFALNASRGLNDMEVIAHFKNSHDRKMIDNLPIIMDSYITKFGLKSPNNHTTAHPLCYCTNCDRFNSIFDGAALGQYLFGTVAPQLGPGFINETCLFNPSLLQYEWHRDQQGRNIPYATLDGKLYKINNLHMHSKKLYLASSTR